MSRRPLDLASSALCVVIYAALAVWAFAAGKPLGGWAFVAITVGWAALFVVWRWRW